MPVVCEDSTWVLVTTIFENISSIVAYFAQIWLMIITYRTADVALASIIANIIKQGIYFVVAVYLLETVNYLFALVMLWLAMWMLVVKVVVERKLPAAEQRRVSLESGQERAYHTQRFEEAVANGQIDRRVAEQVGCIKGKCVLPKPGDPSHFEKAALLLTKRVRDLEHK